MGGKPVKDYTYSVQYRENREPSMLDRYEHNGFM